MIQIFDSLGWALLHSVWQGGVAFLAVIIIRGLLKDSAPALRYNLQVLCLLLCLGAFLVTFGLYQSGGSAAQGINAFSPGQSVSHINRPVIESSLGIQNMPEALSIYALGYVKFLGILWCLGFAAMASRYSVAYILTQKLRRIGLTSAPIFWENKFRTLALNTGVQENVRLFVSRHVSGPLTIGFFKPVVLVPVGFLLSLPQDQVEAILLHELAHIRRYDYFVNLIQTAIKTVFFFHPAIHFISKKIDIDREQACDDLAVAQTRNPQALARGLAALRLQSSGPLFGMAANGNDGPLVTRLKRLTAPTSYQSRPDYLLTPLVAMFIMSGVYFSTTIGASAHSSSKMPDTTSYDPTKFGLENYKFETQTISGRTVTVKISPDGHRWVLDGETWIDIDKSPDAINLLPIASPEPPQAPIYKVGENAGGGFESKMKQFQINMKYFEADMERYQSEVSSVEPQEKTRIERDIEQSLGKVERKAKEQAQPRSNDQELHETLYEYLIQDGYLSAPSEKATMSFENKNWTVNGKAISSSKETKYCRLFSEMGIRKSTIAKIELAPNSTDIINKSVSTTTQQASINNSVRATTQKTHKVATRKHVHKDGTIHDPSAPVAPISTLTAPKAYPSPTQYVQLQPVKPSQPTAAPAFVWPAASSEITAVYGQKGDLWEWYHHGLDIKGNVGTPVFASADGVVELASKQSKWGNRVTLKHNAGFQTLYAHMQSYTVSNGQSVKAGDIIGTIGSTGQSTGPHLHFEIRKGGRPIDPLPFIQ